MLLQPNSTSCHKASLKGTSSFSKQKSSKNFHESSVNENQESFSSVRSAEKCSSKLNENTVLKLSGMVEKPSSLASTQKLEEFWKEIKKSTYQEDYGEVPQIGKFFKSDKFGNVMKIVNHNQSSTKIFKNPGGDKCQVILKIHR